MKDCHLYARVILPLSLPRTLDYRIPPDLKDTVAVGKRVEVALGRKKLYTGIVAAVHDTPPAVRNIKDILSVLDAEPVLYPQQLQLWEWIAQYYACTVGEVMDAALPAGLKLTGETRVVLNPQCNVDEGLWTDEEFALLELLRQKPYLTLAQIQQLYSDIPAYRLVQSLLDKDAVRIYETLVERYRPATVELLRWHPSRLPYEEHILTVLEDVRRSEKQTNAVLSFVQLTREKPFVRKEDLYKRAHIKRNVLNSLVEKRILVIEEVPTWKLLLDDRGDSYASHTLSPLQSEKYEQIQTLWKQHSIVLLRGVTGSGKTHIYIQLIRDILQKDSSAQILYLLPEIALTTQITYRLKEVFGNQILTYHSGMSERERLSVWHAVYHGHPIVLGARSSIFLPFRSLRLIIVDEEHDPSYKQEHPAPRYHARDTAIVMAQAFGAKVLLGSATPSVESYYNALRKKYGLVEILQRHRGVALPKIELIDLKKLHRHSIDDAELSQPLLREIQATLQEGKQVMLFKNRRGYTPIVVCRLCGWKAQCVRCDVSLTYHRYTDDMRCHYCGYREKYVHQCPQCGNDDILLKGYGTERIQEILQQKLPEAVVARFDWDTAHQKSHRERLIEAFELGEIDVLVGTQMITKGLDFHNVGLVGVIGTDQLLHYPDFRSHERAYQLLTQVSGRAGRQLERGKVLIQAYQTQHPVLHYVLNNDYTAFVRSQLQERKSYGYPPFTRLIHLTISHAKREVAEEATELLFQWLRKHIRQRAIGYAPHAIPRLRNRYLFRILIKVEPDRSALHKVKDFIHQGIRTLHHQKGLSTVRVAIDVDPY